MKLDFFRMHGFTLLEIIMSIFLSSLLGVLTLQTYLLAKKIGFQQQAIARLQNNRLAFSWELSQSVYQSGQLPCASLRQSMSWQNAHSSHHAHLFAQHGIQVLPYHELKHNPYISSLWVNRMVPNLPGLWVSYTGEHYKLREPFQAGHQSLTIQANIHWPEGTWLVLDDCSSVTFLQVAKETNCHLDSQACKVPVFSFGLSTKHWYLPETRIGRLQSKIYFVANSLRFNSDGDEIYSLYVSELNGQTQEILEGLEHWSLEPLFNNQQRVIGIGVTANLTSIEPGRFHVVSRFTGEHKAVDRLNSKMIEDICFCRSWA